MWARLPLRPLAPRRAAGGVRAADPAGADGAQAADRAHARGGSRDGRHPRARVGPGRRRHPLFHQRLDRGAALSRTGSGAELLRGDHLQVCRCDARGGGKNAVGSRTYRDGLPFSRAGAVPGKAQRARLGDADGCPAGRAAGPGARRRGAGDHRECPARLAVASLNAVEFAGALAVQIPERKVSMKKLIAASILALSFGALAAEKTETIKVSGWHCGGCAARTESALKEVKGVQTVAADK